MITEAKIENLEKIAEAVRTNNNSSHKYRRNKRSMGEPVILCVRKAVVQAAGKPAQPSPWCACWETTGNTPETERSVLEAVAEKLMKQRTRAEQVKKEKEENRAT